MKIEITQGDADDADLAEVLGEASIEGFPRNEPANRSMSSWSSIAKAACT